jgi:hypothetical protein
MSLDVVAPPPGRNQGPGSSLPEPDAGHPLQGGGQLRREGRRTRPLRARSVPSEFGCEPLDIAGVLAQLCVAGRSLLRASAHRMASARLFRLTGLDRRIPMARTLDDALDALPTARTAP